MKVDNVMQQAEEALDYWESGSMWARLIERDINDNDMEALQFHVDEANAQKNLQESFTHDFIDRLIDGEDISFNTDNWPVVQMPKGVGRE